MQRKSRTLGFLLALVQDPTRFFGRLLIFLFHASSVQGRPEKGKQYLAAWFMNPELNIFTWLSIFFTTQ